MRSFSEQNHRFQWHLNSDYSETKKNNADPNFAMDSNPLHIVKTAYRIILLTAYVHHSFPTKN